MRTFWTFARRRRNLNAIAYSTHGLKRHKNLPSGIRGVLPSMVTIMALGLGLTSMRFALQGEWTMAVTAILVAGCLDGIDGGLARFLNVASDFGAELDSLADFVNFGVAPAFVIYLHSLHAWGGIGWTFFLLFSTCAALRLARFNVYRISGALLLESSKIPYFSIGLPAPAGAFIALLPLMFGFALENVKFSIVIYAFFEMLSAFLMISRLPTPLLKDVPLASKLRTYVLLLASLLMAGLVNFPWIMLSILGSLYLIFLPIGLAIYQRHRKKITPHNIHMM